MLLWPRRCGPQSLRRNNRHSRGRGSPKLSSSAGLPAAELAAAAGAARAVRQQQWRGPPDAAARLPAAGVLHAGATPLCSDDVLRSSVGLQGCMCTHMRRIALRQHTVVHWGAEWRICLDNWYDHVARQVMIGVPKVEDLWRECHSTSACASHMSAMSLTNAQGSPNPWLDCAFRCCVASVPKVAARSPRVAADESLPDHALGMNSGFINNSTHCRWIVWWAARRGCSGWWWRSPAMHRTRTRARGSPAGWRPLLPHAAAPLPDRPASTGAARKADRPGRRPGRAAVAACVASSSVRASQPSRSPPYPIQHRLASALAFFPPHNPLFALTRLSQPLSRRREVHQHLVMTAPR